MSTGGEDQKAVLVTGGSSGIGQCVAVEFAKLGFKIAITGRNQKRLDDTIELLVANSPGKHANSFLPLNADFEDPAQVETVVGETVRKFGRLDILINNAGFSGNSCDIEDEGFFDDFRRVLQVNLLAATRIAQLSVPHLEKTKGLLINVSSIADRMAFPKIPYCVSKAGMSMMGRGLANATEGKGIRVVNVCPGPVKTNFAADIELVGSATSLGRVGQSQEVADLIIFLASEKAGFIHACSIDIDGGFYNKSSNFLERFNLKKRPVD